MKQKFSIENFKGVLSCLKIMKEFQENNLKWAHPPTPQAEVLHLSESMQSLEFDDSLSQIAKLTSRHHPWIMRVYLEPQFDCGSG